MPFDTHDLVLVKLSRTVLVKRTDLVNPIRVPVAEEELAAACHVGIDGSDSNPLAAGSPMGYAREAASVLEKRAEIIEWRRVEEVDGRAVETVLYDRRTDDPR